MVKMTQCFTLFLTQCLGRAIPPGVLVIGEVIVWVVQDQHGSTFHRGNLTQIGVGYTFFFQGGLFYIFSLPLMFTFATDVFLLVEF